MTVRWEGRLRGGGNLARTTQTYGRGCLEGMSKGDLRFEPESALIADNEGYADIFHIIAQAKRFLKPDGWLMIEHGFEQGSVVRQHFALHGYACVETKKDLGDNDRFSVGRQVNTLY